MESKSTVLMELHFLPCVAYLAQVAANEVLLLEQQEHYVKRSYRNRCHIGDSNGSLRLSVPLQKGKNEQQAIRNVRLSEAMPWRSKLWHSIRSVYNKSPFFEHYEEELRAILFHKYEFLFDLNLALLEGLIEWIGLDVEIDLTRSYEKNSPAPITDLRASITPQSGYESARHNFQLVKYPQVFEEKTGFIPNLSAIDLLFCTGPESLRYLEQSMANR